MSANEKTSGEGKIGIKTGGKEGKSGGARDWVDMMP